MNERENTLSFEAFRDRSEWICQHSIIAGWLERLNWSALDVIDTELMTRTRSTAGLREFNNVFANRIDEANVERDLTRCLEILAQDDAPSRWYLTSHPVDSIIAEELRSLGFTTYERRPIMAKDLHNTAGIYGRNVQAQGGSAPASARNFANGQCRVVTNETALKKWTNTLARVGNYSREFESSWSDMLYSCGFQKDAGWRHYYFQKDEEPIAILSALWTDQIVSLETVGVVEEHRNKGIGTNLLRCALEDAANAGFRVAVAYPYDQLQAFFSDNAFEQFGALDCVSIDATQLPNHGLGETRRAVDLPMASAPESAENSHANI